jgi:beta-phosphoglucomutase-like phosphatase (HAD superfamily)
MVLASAGIIFDFNGVLWWDGHLQEQAWRDFSAEFRGVPLTPREMAEHVHGRPNRHTLSYLAGHPLPTPEVERLSEEKEEIYRRLCLAQGEGFRLSPGTIPLLDQLAAWGIPRTIGTASGRANVEFFWTHLALDRWFDLALIVYDDGSLPGKPAPDVYLQAAGKLGLAPASCVVVEDSQSGLQAAHAARIGYVVALGPLSHHSALAALPGVDLVVASLAELPAVRLFR